MSEIAWYVVGAAAVLCVLLAAGSALTSRGYRFASGRVQGVVGLMGSGKSLFVVQRVILPAAKDMTRKRGLECSHTWRPVKRIITNFTMELPYEGVELVTLDGSRVWDHLAELAVEYGKPGVPSLDALVIIDEAHLYMPAAKSKVPQKAAWLTSMARKLNAEIWWITQNQMKIHKRLRDDTQLIWTVGRSASLWTLLTGPSKWFTARAYEPENLTRANRTPVDRRFYRLSKRAIAAYNSFELIVPDAEADVALGDNRPANVVPLAGRKMPEAPSSDHAGSLPEASDDGNASSLVI